MLKMNFDSVLNNMLLVSFCWSKLLWHDEFDRTHVAGNNLITVDDGQACSAWFFDMLSCSTSDERNLRIINGALIMSAAYDHNNDYPKNFTSGYVYTSGHKFTKLEMRAALHHGKLIKSQIILWPATDGGVVITLIDHKNGDTFQMGIRDNIYTYKTDVNLQEFQVYTLINDDGRMTFLFNGEEIFNITYGNLAHKVIDSFNVKFNIHVYLVVHGRDIRSNKLRSVAQSWNCPSFIIDWIRLYDNEDMQGDIVNLVNSNESASTICELNKLAFPIIDSVTQTTQQEQTYTVNLIDKGYPVNHTEHPVTKHPDNPFKEMSTFSFMYYTIPLLILFASAIVILIWFVKRQGHIIERIDRRIETKLDEIEMKTEENVYDRPIYSVYDDNIFATERDFIGESYVELLDDNRVIKDNRDAYEKMNVKL